MYWDKTYKILTDKKFNKILRKKLAPQLKKVFDKKLAYLIENPEHPSLNTKRYSASSKVLSQLGVDEIYEFYINMSYRCVIYIKRDLKELIIAYVGTHENLKAKYG